MNSKVPTDHVLTRGTVVIDVEACKGCDLCIDACPPGVLVMTDHELNARGFGYPQLLARCAAGGACPQISPDFVFQVYRYDTPIEMMLAAATSGVAGEEQPA